jgi:hypothetical protein
MTFAGVWKEDEQKDVASHLKKVASSYYRTELRGHLGNIE